MSFHASYSNVQRRMMNITVFVKLNIYVPCEATYHACSVNLQYKWANRCGIFEKKNIYLKLRAIPNF